MDPESIRKQVDRVTILYAGIDRVSRWLRYSLEKQVLHEHSTWIVTGIPLSSTDSSYIEKMILNSRLVFICPGVDKKYVEFCIAYKIPHKVVGPDQGGLTGA